MSAALHVVRPGLQTTVQDLGRWGHQSSGVSVAGPMDVFAHRWANALVANSVHAATLEVTLSGPELTFDDERLVVVTGAEFALVLDGTPLPWGKPFVVSSGSTLQFGERMRGARAYVGIEGGIDVAAALGSRSTHLPSRMGGWHGRALRAGDGLPLGPRLEGRRPVSTPMPVNWAMDRVGTDGVVRVLRGPDLQYAGRDALETLEREPYLVDQDSNRMGYRLKGPAIGLTRSGDLISDATPMGTIQVLPTGQPVLLMADCQTIGGYPRLAVAIRADLPVAGQAGPGDRLRFSLCSRAAAAEALAARERPLLAYEARR